MRLLLIFIPLGLLFAIPFVLFGEAWDEWLAGDGAVAWLDGWGHWAWAMALLLLMGDLVLPVPATAVLTALGILYGPVAGGFIGTAGSCLAGLSGYAACRLFGRRAALFITGARDMARSENFFERSGGWAVVLSRWLPLLPEVVACLAGLSRMPAGRFCVALVCGTLPMAFVFALVGHLGAERPVLAIATSALLPLLLWPVARRIIFVRGTRTEKPT